MRRKEGMNKLAITKHAQCCS